MTITFQVPKWQYVKTLEVETDYFIQGFKQKGFLLAPVVFLEWGIQNYAPKLFGEEDQLK